MVSYENKRIVIGIARQALVGFASDGRQRKALAEPEKTITRVRVVAQRELRSES